jgi:hypothetical protein
MKEWCIAICKDDVHMNILVNPSRMQGYKFPYIVKDRGFKFIVPLSAFLIVWCTETVNMRIRGTIQCIEAIIERLKERALNNPYTANIFHLSCIIQIFVPTQ